MLTCPDCGGIVELTFHCGLQEVFANCTEIRCGNIWNDLGQRTNEFGEVL